MTVVSKPWHRNPELEREVLNHAMRAGKFYMADYVEKVGDRLAKGAIEYGELQFLNADVIREIAEESHDIGGWTVLLYLKSFRDVADDDQRFEIQQRCLELIALGAQADALCGELKKKWREGARPSLGY